MGNKSILKKVITALVVILVIVAVIGLNVYNYVTDSGFFARRTVAVSSDNYSLSTAQMSYYFYSQYQNMYSMYTSYGLDMSQYLNPNQSLKAQKSLFSSEGETWFDYFMTQAVDVATQQLALCEAAKAAGVELDESDYEEIDTVMDNLKAAAKEQGMSLGSFLKNNYGTYVKTSDIKDAVELEVLAAKYTKQCIDKVDVGDEALEKEYKDNTNAYDKVDYLTYTFDFEDIVKADEEAAKADSDETAETTDKKADATKDEEKEIPTAVKNAAVAEAKGYADRLAKVKTEEEFKEIIKEYLMNGLHMTEAKADETMKKEAFVVEGASHSSTDEQLTWAFSAKAGDVKLFEEAEDHEHKADDDHSKLAKIYTVIMLTKERGRDESIAYRDVRHILFSKDTYENKDKAQEVYDKWIADGAKVEDFKALVEEYSEDTGSLGTDGLYEGVTKGQMVEEFENWLFDDARKEGDHGLVETDYGWHVMRYEGGVEGWKGQIKSDLQSEAQTEAVETAVEDYAVNVNNEALDKIPA